MSKFQIDNYISKLKWEEIQPQITESGRLLPSLMIEEKNLIFLSSLDISIGCEDYDFMVDLLPEIEKHFYNAFLGSSPNYKKAHKAESDYYLLINILRTHSPDSKFEEKSLGNRLKITIIEE